MNKDMAVDAKVPDYMENMLQLEVKQFFPLSTTLSSYLEKKNKLAKARKMRKPGTLSLKKFGLGNFLVKKVWSQYTCILLY